MTEIKTIPVHYNREEIKKVILEVMRDIYQQRKGLRPMILYNKYRVREPDIMFPAEVYQKTLQYFNDLKLKTIEYDTARGIERKTLNNTTFYNRCKELRREGHIEAEKMRVRKNRIRVVYRLKTF